MPITDSTTIIQACLRDILHALQNPSPGSALAPLAISEAAQVQQLALLFDPPTTPPIPAPPPLPAPPAPPAQTAVIPTPLRVPPRVPAPLRVPPDPAQPLRVPESLPPPLNNDGHPVLHDSSSLAVATDLHFAMASVHSHQTMDDEDVPCYRLAYLTIAKILGLDPHSFEIVHPVTGQAYKAVHPDTGRDVEYPELLRSSEGYLWEESCAKEAGWLANGYKQSTGTNTINFIRHDQVHKGRKATYLRNVVAD
jgi:hypothetical protein